MHPLPVIGITFSAHSMLVIAALSRSRSASLETDVSLANLLSLPSSVGLAGDLAWKADQEADMEVSTTVLTKNPAEIPTEVPTEVPMEVPTKVPIEVPAKIDRT